MNQKAEIPALQRLHLIGQCQMLLEEIKEKEAEDIRQALTLAIGGLKLDIARDDIEQKIAQLREDIAKL